MWKVLARGLGVAFVLCVWATTAYADRCQADAEFVHSYPSNSDNNKFKFKFRVASSQCVKYNCRGYIHYTIHFQTEEGKAHSKTSLTSYSIPDGQRSIEVTDETYPYATIFKNLVIRDVEVGEVSCSTP